MAVSSFDTRSTQSNSWPIGRPSRILPASARMIGAMAWRLWGATAGLTVLRWMSWPGGSMAMKLLPRGRFSDSALASSDCSTMPSAEENTS